ncbi:MAG: hypothetical protein ACT4OP_08585 [Actinomycetota bacterium]
MIIDCDTCIGQYTSACDDCVVSFILHDGTLALEDEELDALKLLADQGLVPGLRLVPSTPLEDPDELAV